MNSIDASYDAAMREHQELLQDVEQLTRVSAKTRTLLLKRNAHIAQLDAQQKEKLKR